MEVYEQIEHNLRTEFRGKIISRFTKAIKEFNLIEDGDKICVCISGGKDSFILAKCFQELKRYGKQNFEVGYLVMDPGYSKDNLSAIKNNLKMLNIPAVIFKTDIFNAVSNMGGSPCYMCARMRRGSLYSKAKELGYNKIALGHHFDDVVETILMGILYNGQIKTMLPKVKSENFEGMQIIRPLYRVEEDDILKFKEKNKLTFINCACLFKDACGIVEGDDWTDPEIGKRREMKLLLKELCKKNKQAKLNIFNSVIDVKLDNIISYK